jgi:hypothetical protein
MYSKQVWHTIDCGENSRTPHGITRVCLQPGIDTLLFSVTHEYVGANT